MAVTIALVLLALLIGYALGKMAAPSFRSLNEHLEAIRFSMEQLTKVLCGDKDIERAIKMTNDAGADLNAEELAYDGGSLRRIEHVIRGFAEQVERLAETTKKNI